MASRWQIFWQIKQNFYGEITAKIYPKCRSPARSFSCVISGVGRLRLPKRSEIFLPAAREKKTSGFLQRKKT